MRSETYSYGQGKVFLGENRGADKPILRWVGDVSELSISLSVEEFTHKESYSGQRQEVRKLITGKSGEVSIKFHEFSAENLSLMLLGSAQKIDAGSASAEKLPEKIAAGDVVALAHQNVKSVTIDSLEEGTDFIVDSTFGSIEFLKEVTEQKTVRYSYGAAQSVAMLSEQPKNLFLRFEGVNLAENNQFQVVELYKVNFNPTEALNLINNENNLDGLSAKAKVLADTSKVNDKSLGRFGRVVKFNVDAAQE